jgi:ribonuclease H2 subunit A
MEERGELISKRQFGSGYPSDPICKMWIQKSMTDPVFGFSDIIRFSWAPTKQRLSGSEPDATDAAKVTFLADLDDEEEENMKQSKGMAQFLNTTFQGGKNNSGTSKRKRSAFFDSRKIKVARSIV